MELDFDKLFKIPCYALKLNRSHPYIKKDKKWLFQAGIMHAFFTSVFVLIIYSIVYHDLKTNNFAQICKNGVTSIVYIVVSLQYCVLLYHQDSLLLLIKSVKKDYLMAKICTQDKNIVQKYANRALFVCKQWLMIPVVTCGSYLVKSIVLMVYYYSINEFRFVPFYNLTYPSIIEERKDNIYVFTLTYTLFLLYAAYAGTMYVAYVPLGPILMLHACGQLEIVKKRIDCLFVDTNPEIIQEKFRDIIKRLQYIYRFVNIITEIYKIAYELTLKAVTIMLPIALYEIIDTANHGELSVELITFVIACIPFIGSPCYYSDLLMEKGEDLCFSLYSCGWELSYDRCTRTTLQIMLLYALRPIAIRTVFRPLCLQALTLVFHQSYALFNLINAMWK